MIPQIILALFGGAVLLAAVRRLRAYRLKERYVLFFTLIGLPFLALAIWPTAVDWIGRRLHIQYFTVTSLCIVAFMVVVIFELLTILSLQDRRISTLAQIVGIMMEKQGMSDRPGSAGAAEDAHLP